MEFTKILLTGAIAFTTAFAHAETQTESEREELEVKAMKYDLIRTNPTLITVGEKILDSLKRKDCGIKESKDFWRSNLVADDAEYGDLTLFILAMMSSYDDSEFPYYFEQMQNTATCQGGDEWYKRFKVATGKRTKENNEKFKSKAGGLNSKYQNSKSQHPNTFDTII